MRNVQQQEQLSAALMDEKVQEGFTTDFYIPMRREHVLKKRRSHPAAAGQWFALASSARKTSHPKSGGMGGPCQTRADLTTSPGMGTMIPGSVSHPCHEID